MYFFGERLPIVCLLHFIVIGDEVTAEKIIKVNPTLLLEKDRVIDYSGRIVWGTPLQVALGAGDGYMCKMIARYLFMRTDGFYHLEMQYRIQFPFGEDYEDDNERQIHKALLRLKKS